MANHCGGSKSTRRQKRRLRRKHHRESRGRPSHKHILLMGLPNVGKSAIFSRFTGIDAMVSNYSGTTVEFYEGQMDIEGETYLLRDAPGVYNLKDSQDDAERVAVNMLEDGPEAIIFVLDALNFESSLHLLLQVLEYNIPTVVSLNRTDLMKSRGMKIDYRALSERLKVSVVPTVALKTQSLDVLKYSISKVFDETITYDPPETDTGRWRAVETITHDVVKSPGENGDDRFSFLVKPLPGIPIALGVLALMFAFVIGVGMGTRQLLLLLFDGMIFPLIEQGVSAVVSEGAFRNVLIGEYGFLIKGIEWPFALVLPYVMSFYIMISILEDTGYLPRIAVLLDGLFKKIGLNGSSVIPILLGYGCGIPAIMSTRALPSKKQRLSVAVMVSFAVPCVAQSGAFVVLLVERSLLAFFAIFIVSIIAMILSGLVIDRFHRQKPPFTLMELPPLLLPKPKILSRKILFRIKHYLKDGAVPMVIAIGAAALLYELGVLIVVGDAMSPLVTGWLNLPSEASTPLIMGIVRRELTVLPLIDMDLTTAQFFTGALVALFYVPCIAMIATLAKEFSIRTSVAVFLFTTLAAFFIGGLFARSYELIGILFG